MLHLPYKAPAKRGPLHTHSAALTAKKVTTQTKMVRMVKRNTQGRRAMGFGSQLRCTRAGRGRAGQFIQMGALQGGPVLYDRPAMARIDASSRPCRQCGASCTASCFFH